MLLRLQIGILLILAISDAAENAKKAPPQQSAKKTEANKEIVVENVQFAVFPQDLSQPTPSDLHKINPGGKLPTKLAVDPQKKMKLTFAVKDKKAAAPVTVHQAFVLLIHEESKREIVYVAEPDKTTKLYTFDLDMKTHAKDFSGVAGLYSINLVLADSTVANPLQWHFADLDLNLPPAPAPTPLPKSARINYKVLPEIHHQFRQSEPRPPAIVSDAFAAICAAPLLIFLILSFRIGLNFGNLKLSIWALGFHVGLCAIFGLYACYWLKLDMFETLKWLTIVAVPTLFCGNRLLHSFSSAKKQKPE